jgi:hypothetical protein
MDLKFAVIVLVFAGLVLGMPVAGITGPSLGGAEVAAEQRVNAAEASIDSMEQTEEALASQPGKPVSMDEEIRDEEVIDEDA